MDMETTIEFDAGPHTLFTKRTFITATQAEDYSFWSHTPRQPWWDQKYYERQRKILRPAQFSRLHENQWVSSESRFIEPGNGTEMFCRACGPILPARFSWHGRERQT